MEERKQKEIEYYDEKAESWLKEVSEEKWKSDFEGFNPLILSSYKFCYTWLKENCQNKFILDYGCGNGIHSVFLVKCGAKKVIGIDLSEKSLEIARERTKKEGIEDKIKFLNMDCEKTDFPDNYFDIVISSGTLYSLNKKRAISEIVRLLKDTGTFLAVETLGHNPFTNLKRRINKIFGKRTGLAVTNILKIEDIEVFKKYFNSSEVYFFHIISWLAFPFLNLPIGKILLKLFEKIDGFLRLFPFLRKYAFKVVFLLSFPKK